MTTQFQDDMYLNNQSDVGRQQDSFKFQRKNTLRLRLIAFVLAVSLPILAVIVIFVSNRGGSLLEEQADSELQAINRGLSDNVSAWLDYNVQLLDLLVTLPEITSMEAEQQKPILEAIDAAYPHLFLVQTTDVNGMNVARNDDQENKDYNDRLWYQGAMTGAPVTLQSLISRTTGEPALNLAAPIRDENGQIIGVGSIVSELDDISSEVQVSTVGETGFAYVVDAGNRVIAHPNPEFSAELLDISAVPPIVSLRQGTQGLTTFTDGDGQEWRAYVSELENGWGVVVQQQTDELLSGLRLFQRVAWTVAVAGLIVLAFALFWVIHRSLRPIGTLTDTAMAIAAGELDRRVPVQRNDEIGVLAAAFNSMTEQLRNLIGSLEQRVTARTQRLELIASLSERLNAILDLDQLLDELVSRVKEQFDYYHAHVYIIDDERQSLVVAAGAGEAGAKMKEEHHRISLDTPTSLVARAARTQEVVRVDNVREADDWLPNPHLQDTYAEMAVPIILQGQVVGVLDVQDDAIGGLDESDASLLRSLANQVAVAIRNARLFSEVETALAEARELQKRYVEQAWDSRRLARRKVGRVQYSLDQMKPLPETMIAAARQEALVRNELAVVNLPDGDLPGADEGQAATTLVAPIALQNVPVGDLQLHGLDPNRTWTERELALIEAVLDQVAQAAENLRLIEETRERASRERLIGQVSDKLRRAPDMDTLLKVAVGELGRVLGPARTFVHLEPERESENSPENGSGNGGTTSQHRTATVQEHPTAQPPTETSGATDNGPQRNGNQ
jgi:GAF domain-containing protein/HAMP domain-containing protein